MHFRFNLNKFFISYCFIKQRLFLLFMSVFFQSFLTLMRSHFMSFSLFSAWHNNLFNLVFNLCHKGFSWLKRWNKMFRNNDRSIS